MVDLALGKAQGCLVGLACGDAVGTTLEFRRRGTFTPLTDMVGGGPFQLQKGQWTDDTSMALCLAHSLLACQGFDAKDQMDRYVQWYLHGYMSSNGHCFDIGNTVRRALDAYQASGDPYSGPVHPRSSGNGSLMRLAPIPIFYHEDLEQAEHFGGESSRTTHGSDECVDACRYFGVLLATALRFPDKGKDEILDETGYAPCTEKVQSIARKEFLALSYEDIRGTGYVIDCLQSALWCFYHGEKFADAVLLAANLGDDADTTAAVCGQIAGAFYGMEAIPEHWRTSLTMLEDIAALAEELYRSGH